jgi:membrane associated rhomboid family serine protease
MIEVFAAERRSDVIEAALVLTAVGIENYFDRSERGWALFVEPTDQIRAHTELQQYWRENEPSSIAAVPADIVDSGWPGVLGYLFVIWLVPALQTYLDTDLRTVGGLDAAMVRSGEVWRAVTALTLHADIAHIAANSLFGTVFGLFVGRYVGSGVGWLLVLLSATAANLLNALIQPTGFRAIGASTATFAALGLIPAFGWRRGFFRGRGFKRGFAPVFAAIALLSFTGFGSENVDALGHIFGFLAGLFSGLAVANIRLSEISQADQQRAGIFAGLLVAVAWLMAL